MGAQMCGAQTVVTRVTVTCHRTREHKGPHSSSTYGTRWRDTGEVLPPLAPPQPRTLTCETDGCNLWREHAGPHGLQDSLL